MTFGQCSPIIWFKKALYLAKIFENSTFKEVLRRADLEIYGGNLKYFLFINADKNSVKVEIKVFNINIIRFFVTRFIFLTDFS